MRVGPPLLRLRSPAADRLPRHQAVDPHRYGSLDPPSARPRLRSSRSRPPAAGPYARPMDALGRRASRAHPEISAGAEIDGTVEPVYPSFAPEPDPVTQRLSALSAAHSQRGSDGHRGRSIAMLPRLGHRLAAVL